MTQFDFALGRNPVFTKNSQLMRNFAIDEGHEPVVSDLPHCFTFENHNIWSLNSSSEFTNLLGGIGHTDYRQNLDVILLYINF